MFPIDLRQAPIKILPTFQSMWVTIGTKTNNHRDNFLNLLDNLRNITSDAGCSRIPVIDQTRWTIEHQTAGEGELSQFPKKANRNRRLRCQLKPAVITFRRVETLNGTKGNPSTEPANKAHSPGIDWEDSAANSVLPGSHISFHWSRTTPWFELRAAGEI
jgi:hypothetical protein